MLAAVAARPFLGRPLLTAAATGRMARPLASIAALCAAMLDPP